MMRSQPSERSSNERYGFISMDTEPVADVVFAQPAWKQFSAFYIRAYGAHTGGFYFANRKTKTLTLLNDDVRILASLDEAFPRTEAYELTSDDRDFIATILLGGSNTIERLVFSGGGAKGGVYQGACVAIESMGIIQQAKEVAGSSVGSLPAAMIAAGLSTERLNAIMNVNIKSLMGERIGRFYGNEPGTRVITRSGDPLYKKIQEGVAEGVRLFMLAFQEANIGAQYPSLLPLYEKCCATLDPCITFADLATLNQHFPTKFKKLTVTAVRSTDGQLQIFNADLTPEVEVALACRASCALPAILAPVPITIGADTTLYSDGGLYDNIPTDYFDGVDEAGEFIPNQKKESTLVFVFESSAARRALHGSPDEVPYYPKRSTRVKYHLGVRVLAGIDMSYSPLEQKGQGYTRIRDEYPLRTVPLKVKPVATEDFTLATKMAKMMRATGYIDTMNALINNHLYDCAFQPEAFYREIVNNFQHIYQAVLVGSGRSPQKDVLLQAMSDPHLTLAEQYHTLRESLYKAAQQPSSNAFAKQSFALIQAVAFHRGEITAEALFKKTYVESFRHSGLFSISKIAGERIYRMSTLQDSLESRNMFGLFGHRKDKLSHHTRAGKVKAALQQIERFSEAAEVADRAPTTPIANT